VEAVTDNYPILVAAAPLPVIQEQAECFRRYLADDANVFGAEFLEEQRRRLNAVYSYIKDRKIRAELSHCQRWVELRIGEWLGPTVHGQRHDLNSLPGKELSRDINDRHKHEFRFMAEHKEIVAGILENSPGEAITRAALITEIRESNLRECSPLQWSEEELARRERVEAGLTVVANLWGARDKLLLNWARSNDLLVRVDRISEWGNPFEMPADGGRDTVCDRYILHHLLQNPSLANKIHSLKGRVLACWCYPERCHGDYLAEWANEPDPSLFYLATRALALTDSLSKFVETVRPEDVWQVLKDYEKSALFANLRVIGDWVEQIKEKDRQGEKKTGQDSPRASPPPELP
jgi:hypothetical protein